MLPALWIHSASSADLDRIEARGQLLHGIVVHEDETIVTLGSNLTTPGRSVYLHRLPRINSFEHHLVADNTDAALSMGSLLEEFVRRALIIVSAGAH